MLGNIQVKDRTDKVNMPPGTIMHIGEKKAETVKITIIDYDENNFQERQVQNIEESFQFKQTPSVTWINIDGLHDVSIIEKIGQHFELHPLVLEDIVTTGQRPKIEDYETYIFIVLKMLSYNMELNAIQSEQVSVVLGKNYVISFQESAGGDVFDTMRDRIRTSKGKIRKMAADYLAYSLIDAVVDHYFLILERLTEQIEDLEDELVEASSNETGTHIRALKRELIFLRKSVWPLREVVGALARTESDLVAKSTEPYLRDVYDHTVQVIDTVETFRDMASVMLECYLSSISNRLNAIMKVLTVIATIFMPLTFITGIYGMNFKFMPELEWQYGYFFVWVVITVITGGMLFYFSRKKWL